MSGRTCTTLADGRRVQGFRKTMRRNPRRLDPFTDAASDLPYTLRFKLPGDTLVRPGPTGIAGVTVDDLGYAQVAGHGLEWVLRKASEFIAAVCGDLDRDLPFTVQRGRQRRAGSLIYVPGASVVVPRSEKTALVFPVSR